MINTDKLTDIFFDLDHTLWDFEKNSALTFKLIFDRLDLPVNTEDFLYHYTPINHAYWKLYREDKITQEELRTNRLTHTFRAIDYVMNPSQIKVISDLYITHLSTFPHLFDGAHELLKNLKKEYRLHVITNGFEQVQQFKIENSGLQPYFENTITAEKVGYKKPHPKIFHTALALANTTNKNALMIGDSLEADVEGALNVGMQAIHFNSHTEEEHQKCPIVYSLADLNFLIN